MKKVRTDSEVWEEQAIHMEHEGLFKKKLDLMSVEFYDRVFSEEHLYQKDIEELFAHDATHQDLLTSIGKNERLFGLYVANGIGLMSEEAKRRGLPEEQVEYVKRTCFVEIADTDDAEHMEEIARLAGRMMNRIYRKYVMGKYTHLICRAVEFIHRKRFEPLAPRDVASYLECDRTYLAKRFKEETGKTLTEYIRDVKMDAAAHLIGTHSYSLLEVAESLGYSSYPYFSRVFREYYGVAPEYYESTLDSDLL